MLKKQLLSTLLLLVSIVTFAQQVKIKGNIKDAKTNEALIGVNITVQGTTVGATTDIDGNYELETDAGDQVLVFSYVGYEDKIEKITLKTNENKTFDYTMGESDNLLDIVVVSGSKFEKPIGEETVSIDVIRPVTLAKQNMNTIDDAIKRSPGVTVIDGQANIRGGSGFSYGAGSRVMMLLDDLPILQPDAGFPSWGSLPIENIGQIEIIKGAASALYGSSAMNGIINLRTAYATSEPVTKVSMWGQVYDNPNQKEVYIDVNGDKQTEKIDKRWWLQDSITIKSKIFGAETDTTLLNPYTQRPHEWGMSFSHKQKMLDDKADLVVGGQITKGQGFKWGDYNTRARFNIQTRYRINEKTNFGINMMTTTGKSGNFFLWNGTGVNKYLPSLATGIPTDSRSFRMTIDPFFNFSDSKGNRHKILTRYFRNSIVNTNNQSNSSNYFYGEYQYQRRIDKINMTITTGGVGNYTNSEAALYSGGLLYSYNIAGYIQLDNKFWKKLSTSVGFRFESNKISNFEIETKPVARVGLNYQAAEYTFIRASFGQGYRFPTIAEAYIDTELGEGFGIFSNPNLKFETGYSAEFGIKQGLKLGKFQAFADLAAFYTRYTNMMEFGFAQVAGELGFQSKNIGNTQIYGTEANISGEGKFLGMNTQAMMGYTFIVPKYFGYDATDPKYTDDVVDYNVLKYRFRHTFTGAWDVDYKGFGAGASFQYFSFMENFDNIFMSENSSANALLDVGIRDFRNGHLKDNATGKKPQHQYKGDAILDVRVSYEFGKKDRYKFSFLVRNVTNREYALRPGLIEAPRNYSVRLDMTWK